MKKIFLAVTVFYTFFSLHAFAEPLPVAASFSILGDIVQNIGGERIKLVTLVGPDQDAHVFQPTPSEVKKLAGTQLFFVSGLGFEGWLKRLQEASNYPGQVITATRGIHPIARTDPENKHDHENRIDPHVWQDPQQVKYMVKNIADALLAADPAGKDYYLSRASNYSKELDQLLAWAQKAIASVPENKRKVLTSHDAFAYLGKRFGIQLLSPQGVSTEAEASAKDVAELIRQMKKSGIRALFVENISNPKLIEQIARETHAPASLKLHSDALSVDPSARTYLEMYRSNINALVSGMRANQ